MYDWLLFLHLLAAFLLSVTAVTYSAVAFGAPAGGRTLFVADRCWDVGGLGTLILGVWLALYLDEYEIWDGWIIGAIVLWLAATGLGESIRKRRVDGRSAGGAATCREPRGAHALASHPRGGRPARPHDLEAGRMTVLAAIRPDDWNFPLFLHVLSAMVLFGAVVLAVVSVGGNSQAGLRLGFRSLLIGAIPAWIVMRLSAQWIASEEGLLDEGVEVPAWIDIGFITSEASLLVLIAATVCAGIAARRGRGGGLRTATVVLVAITIVAYVVAIWAMSTKPT